MTAPPSTPRWLSEDDRELRVAFARMLIWLPTALDEQLQRDSELSHFEYGILAALSDAEAATLRMSGSRSMPTDRCSACSRAVTRLEKRDG